VAEGVFDVFVIGGGINGCGIARDAAGRGYSVFLAEMNDLASGTSSWSTKLIHGGLRYLEHYEFRLVREALRERELLWRSAPHIIRPMRFVLPHQRGLRPAWLLRLGLFLYDHIGGREALPKTRMIDLRRDPMGRALKPGFSTAFEFSDCLVDDARLVVLNARDAAARGAEIRTRTKVVAARRTDGHWQVEIAAAEGGRQETVTARLVVNAAGPWVDRVLAEVAGEAGAHNVRLVQGSHIVVPRRLDDARAFFFQAPDGRVVFAIPYEGDFTLIGTTDRDFSGDPAGAQATEAEIAYLCDAASAYFAAPVQRADVVWAFSGVRPLYDDGASKAQEATRDYVLREAGEPAMINVFGGKLTTYRRLAEAVMAKIEARIGRKGPRWTHSAALPGGSFPARAVPAQVAALRAARPQLDAARAERLVRLYGTEAAEASGAPDAADHDFGAGLRRTELDYLIRREWAKTGEDVLWRRTKLGLRLSEAEATEVDAYVRAAAAARSVAAE
jgi:glycerol-3-phosphate dehydrogenase